MSHTTHRHLHSPRRRRHTAPATRPPESFLSLLEPRTLLAGFVDPDYRPPFDGAQSNTTPQVEFLAGGKSLHAANVNFTPTLWRQDADGTLDTSFGSGGRVTYDANAYDVEVAPDGKIVLTEDGNVRRLTAAGAPDTTFGGGDGVFVIPPSTSVPTDLEVQNDGKIVYTDQFRIIRLTAAGAIDTTFGGGDGMANFPPQNLGGTVNISDVELRRSDGRIVAIGTETSHGGSMIGHVAVFSPNGTLEWRTDIPIANVNLLGTGVQDLAVAPNGSLFVSGFYTLDNDPGLFEILMRFPAPNSGEFVKMIDFGDTHAIGAFIVTPDNKVLASVHNIPDESSSVYRYTNNLDNDTSFGLGGRIPTDFSVTGLALQSDGFILADGVQDSVAAPDYGPIRQTRLSPTQLPDPNTQTPFTGTPFAINQLIQAEDFDNGGQGVSFSDTDAQNAGGRYRSTAVDIELTGDTGGGYNVGYTRAGEWLEYTINVPSTGSYAIQTRLAAVQNGRLHYEVDGESRATVLITPTQGFQSYRTVTHALGTLSAGTHVLRLAFDATSGTRGVANVNWLRIVPVNQPVQDTQPPSAVPNFRVFENQVLGSISYQMAWDAATDNVGVAGYRLSWLHRANFNDDGVYETRAESATLGPDARSYVVGGSGGESFQDFQIVAFDAAGNVGSPNSAPGTRGLTATYFNNDDFTSPVFTRIDPAINFDWGYGSPDPRMGSDTFSVRWTGQIFAPDSQDYAFAVRADDRGRLIIDGTTVVNYIPGQTPNTGSIYLVSGPHSIVYEYVERTGAARARLDWSVAGRMVPVPSDRFTTAAPNPAPADTTAPSAVPNFTFEVMDLPGSQYYQLNWGAAADNVAVAGYRLRVEFQDGAAPQIVELGPTARSWDGAYASQDLPSAFRIAAFDAAGNVGPLVTATQRPFNTGDPGLTATYFNNPDFTNPAFTRTDAAVNFNWDYGSPDPRIAPDTFSIRWSGRLIAPRTERFTFTLRADDAARLLLNGQTLINYNPGVSNTYTASIDLVAGQSYDLTLEYVERTGRARAALFWQSATTPYQVIPSANLRTA
jgi:uncharacterized delta-60 repeat protein